jgi:tRNA A-37 threonylcarbamoyl transferase component Bud32
VILTDYIDGTKVKLKPEHEDKEYKKWEYVDARLLRLCKNALQYLNSYGIEHGDARTSNFLIVNGEVAKILDFGFSECHEYTFRESLKDDDY